MKGKQISVCIGCAKAKEVKRYLIIEMDDKARNKKHFEDYCESCEVTNGKSIER